MNHRLMSAGALAALLVVFVAVGSRRAPTVAAPVAGRAPVLVELFTSEGCSSCPPADAVLSELTRRQPVGGAKVIALGEHVDYWNNGRWADRFSQHAFSVRQNEYAQFFHNNEVYTPQMIVDGRAEFVGSDGARADQAIAQAARAPKADVQVSAGAVSGAGVPLQIRVAGLPAVERGDKALVMLAVTEDGLASQVRGGENSGRSLSHSAVVRQMRLLGTATQGAVFTAQPSLQLSPGWNHAHLQVVVFVQEQNSRRVLGVGAASLR